ncbi:hypothetical protein WMY93_031793 [Mugilogobius chulae]|uniref:Ion transport domain-containing protein n=1 Tax=Mugilogobius chulae TaxID=88201 RepID=A0AAW0MH01_9GOBI
MHLFGCKFKFLLENDMWRKNFDNPTWSMVTVFQLLTQEDWNYVLYNAMAASTAWSAIYFIVTIILGKNLFLNVLVSIVLHNFQALVSAFCSLLMVHF